MAHFKNKNQLIKELKNFQGVSLIQASEYLKIPYQTIKGWVINNQEYHSIVLSKIMFNLGEYVNDTDKSKVYGNLLSKIVEKDLKLHNNTDINLKVDNTSPLNKIGWAKEIEEVKEIEDK